MRVGIVTFHRAENFGAVMQAFALQTYLISLGHNVDIIDYRCKAIEMHYDILNPRILFSRKNIFHSFMEYTQRLLSIRERTVKGRKYDSFRKQFIHMSQSVNEVNDCLGYDAYVTGSDQVWNLHITKGFDKSFFLDFKTRQGVRKLSFAASAEQDPKGLMLKESERLKNCLSSFCAISVREPFLMEQLSHFTNKKISVCCDPTFLIGKDVYESIMTMPSISKYVLYYEMTVSPAGESLARKLARQKGLSLVIIQGGYRNRKKEEGIITLQDVGPTELLGYIAKADIVITTSFHGLSLSLIFNKEFWALSHSGNLRQQHILSILGLDRRMIDNETLYDDNDTIDYQKTNKLIAEYISSSTDYLIRNL